MAYLIDGHNLIPKIPGLSLRDPEDETKLLRLLQEYARRTRTRLEVFFDQAPDLEQRTRRYGAVTVHFVTRRSTADEAIIRRIEALGRAARQYTVVTSDRRIQVNVRAAGARVLTSEAFARRLQAPAAGGQSGSGSEKPAPPGTEEELQEWLRLFGEDRAEG